MPNSRRSVGPGAGRPTSRAAAEGMKTTVTGRHVDVTPDLHRVIRTKLDKVERVLNDSGVSAQVILSDGRHECVTEVVVHARGDHQLRGEGRGRTWSQAIAGAVDKVDQQAHTLKGKWETRRRRATPTSAV